VLIRHAEPVVTDGMPPAEWPLSDQGRCDARELGSRLADASTATVVWTSPERKARETAALAFPSVVPRVRKELSEVKRAWYANPDELAGAVATYLWGEVVEGWEHRDDVIARMASLKADFEQSEFVVVVSHGVLLTTWLHHEIGLEDPFGFWSNLRTPDAWELDLEKKVLERTV
jgi:broad specificity phosphatase PhoE